MMNHNVCPMADTDMGLFDYLGEGSSREGRKVEGVGDEHLCSFSALWTLLLNQEAQFPEIEE